MEMELRQARIQRWTGWYLALATHTLDGICTGSRFESQMTCLKQGSKIFGVTEVEWVREADVVAD